MAIISIVAMVILFFAIIFIEHRIGTTNKILKKQSKTLESILNALVAGLDVEEKEERSIECDWCKVVIPESTASNFEGAVICPSCWKKQYSGV